jgi:hypothetical protein
VKSVEVRQRIFPEIQQDPFDSKRILIKYYANYQNVVLDLKLSDKFMSGNHFMSYQSPNSGALEKLYDFERDLCHYEVSCY